MELAEQVIKKGMYVVAEFIEEEENGNFAMSVVSDKWVFQEGNKIFSLWPTHIRSDAARTKAVLQHQELNQEMCPRCPINIKYKSYDYSKALNKMKALENLSSVSQSETDETQYIAKRSIKPNRFYDNNYRSDISSDEEYSIPKPPKIIPKDRCNTMENGYAKSISQQIISSPNGAPSHSNIVSNVHQFECSGCKKNEVLLQNLTASVEKITQGVKFLINTASIQNAVVGDSKTDLKPAETTEELQELNDALEDSAKLATLVATLHVVGGKDVFDTTRRAMNSIMTSKLALSYNWSGRNQKENFSSLKNVLKLIIVTVRKNPLSRNGTQQEIENVIKVWLRSAGDRDGGRNNRRKCNKEPQ